MNERRLLVLAVTGTTIAYMVGFCVLYAYRVWPAVRAIMRALGG